MPNSPREEPPILGYTTFEVAVYVVGLVTVGLSLPFSHVWGVLPTWVPYVGLSLVLGTVAASQWINRRKHRELLSLARRHDYLLCVHCGYPVAAAMPTGRCPECGKEFERDHARALWLSAERSRQK